MSGTRIIDLTVPRLGETMEEGAVRDWLKAVGDTFQRGDAIVEIETDKTIAEVPAMMAGRLVEILAASGETLEVGARLARIEVAASDAPPVSEPAGEAPPGNEVYGAGPVRATPAARRLARRAKLDIRRVTGSGRRGRIETDDVHRAASGPDPGDGSKPCGADEAAATLQRLGDVAYITSGPADGEPTMLLHGFAGDHSAWAALTQALSRAGRRVVVPDLPGHGATTLEATSAEQLSQRLEDVVGLCAGSRPCHLVAHSLGAAPALALAEHVSVASLTLLAPVGIGSTIDGEFLRGMASPGSAGELAHLLRRLSERSGVMSTAAIEALNAELSRGRLRELAASMVGEIGQTLDLVPAIERWARKTSVRVIVGHRDRIIDWRDACRLSTRVAVHHFPDAGHMPHWDAPSEVAQILVERS